MGQAEKMNTGHTHLHFPMFLFSPEPFPDNYGRQDLDISSERMGK